MSQKRGLARTRQPHDTKDLALLDGKAGIGHADHTAKPLQRFVFVDITRLRSLQSLIGTLSENLPKIAAFDCGLIGRSF